MVGNSLIHAYTKCDNLRDAKQVFQRMATKDLVTWTSMVAANAQLGHPAEALATFHQMELEGIQPSDFTFCAISNAAISNLRQAKAIHGRVVMSGYDSDRAVCNSLINLYGKCRAVEDARAVFERLQGRRNVVSWSSIIGVYAQEQLDGQALALFRKMDLEGQLPNEATLVAMLEGCSQVQQAQEIHSSIQDTDLDSSVKVGTAIINVYGKCGLVEAARVVFDRLPVKDLIAWTAMLAAYSQAGRTKDALKLYHGMCMEGVRPDQIALLNLMFACSKTGAKLEGKLVHSHMVQQGADMNVVGNSLVSFHGACGALEQSKAVFDSIRVKDVAAWNSIVAVYGKYGEYEQSLALLWEMSLEGSVCANEATFTSLLCSSSHKGALDKARDCFQLMAGEYNVVPTIEHIGCIVDLLGRTGCWLAESEELLSMVPASSVSWMTLLSGCRHVEAAERAAKQVMELDPGRSSPYVLLSYMYRTMKTE